MSGTRNRNPAITNLLPGDWNGDGRWDVLLGADTGVELWVAGRESGLERKFRGTAYRQPVEADMNGEGIPDVLVERTAADGKTEPRVGIGAGAGSFVPMKRQPPEAVADGGIEEQTKIVLDLIQIELENAGSSMDRVLKCNVYLADLRHYGAMNNVFLGRFGPEPPVRTTVAVAGIPLKGALVEIDVIACIWLRALLFATLLY